MTQRVRTAKMCTAFPAGHDRLAAGQLGVDQVRELARAFANPRCGEQLGAVIVPLMDVGESHIHQVFVRAGRQWERVADADGSHRSHERAHVSRSARMALIGDEGYLDARIGAVQFAQMKEVFDRFSQAEFDAEWDQLPRSTAVTTHALRCSNAPTHSGGPTRWQPSSNARLR